MSQTHPLIGTAVWVRKDGKYLLGVRTKKTGTGTWCPPGGHLEMFETLEECVVRETREEASIEIDNIRFLCFGENPFPEGGTHYITMHYEADWESGEPAVLLSEVSKWDWFSWDSLPKPLFKPAQLFLESGSRPHAPGIEFIH